MDKEDYENLKQECWYAFCNDHLKGEVQWLAVSRKDVFNLTFDRAYRLGMEAAKKEQQPEPKYHVGDKVVRKGRNAVRTITNIEPVSDECGTVYYYDTVDSQGNNIKDFTESELEPYTEPQEDNTLTMKPITKSVAVYLASKDEDTEFRQLLYGNGFIWNVGNNLLKSSCWSDISEKHKIHYIHPDKTVTYYGEKDSETLTFQEFKDRYLEPKKEESDCIHAESEVNPRIACEDSHANRLFDNILKDSFRNDRLLNIAAMMLQGILANPFIMERYFAFGENEDKVARCALIYADALIAESEMKGGKQCH